MTTPSHPSARRSFEVLVAEADTVSVDGWDFYFSQQVGPHSVFELIEYFLGPQPETARNTRHPDHARRDAAEAGLDIVDLRYEELRTEFSDIGAVIYFLRKVIWMVPGFTVAEYRDRLRDLHDTIEAEGPFVATTTRYLVEARKTA